MCVSAMRVYGRTCRTVLEGVCRYCPAARQIPFRHGRFALQRWRVFGCVAFRWSGPVVGPAPARPRGLGPCGRGGQGSGRSVGRQYGGRGAAAEPAGHLVPVARHRGAFGRHGPAPAGIHGLHRRDRKAPGAQGGEGVVQRPGDVAFRPPFGAVADAQAEVERLQLPQTAQQVPGGMPPAGRRGDQAVPGGAGRVRAWSANRSRLSRSRPASRPTGSAASRSSASAGAAASAPGPGSRPVRASRSSHTNASTLWATWASTWPRVHPGSRDEARSPVWDRPAAARTSRLPERTTSSTRALALAAAGLTGTPARPRWGRRYGR